MAIKGLNHINIATTRLEETTAFFCDVLGLEKGWRPTVDIPGAWLYSGDQPVVHLMEVADPPRPSKGSALDHFAFSIDDFEGTLDRVVASGVEHRVSGFPASGVRQIVVTDVNGAIIELNCRG